MLVTPLHLWELPRDLVFILDYLRQYLEGAGYHLIEHHLCGRNGQHGETWHPDPILEEMAKANSVPAAWILIRPQASVQRWFSERDLPALIIGSRFPGMNLASVDMDHRVSCQHAINLFLAQGHQRIVLLSPKDGLARDLLAEQVFLETIVAEEVELKVGRYDGTKGGLCCTLEALLDTLRLPLALLASRAQHALTTLTYLQSRGLSVPRQIAIISRNHDDYLACTIPEISRYMLPAEFVARKVFRMALHLVQSGERSDCLLIPEFVKGGTV